jgi:signal peptidase II
MTVGPAVIDGEHEPTAPAADPLAAPPTSRLAGLGLPLAIAAVVVLLDQLTKHWALHALIDSSKDVFWTLRFNLSFNSGMAFSAGRGVGPIIGAVAIVVIVVLALSARHAARDSRLAAVAAGLVVGGAIGNLVDRLFRGPGWLHGAVIDFVDFQWFPIFNLADAAITIGGALFIIWTLRRT